MNLRSRTIPTIRSLLVGFSAASLLGISAPVSASTNLSVRESTSHATFPNLREVLQEGLNPHVDLTLGLSSPEGSYKTGSEFGFGFGFQPYIPFGLGMSLTHSSNVSQDKSKRNLERTTVLVKGSYHFAGDIPLVKYSHVGFATGPVMNQDATYFGFAPIYGFDIPVQEWVGEYVSYVSVGVEARYLIVTSNESDGLTVNGALKYWF
jgi:hypothetical protein